jgi:hypothetical protein
MNRICANLNVLARFNDRYVFSGDALRAEIRNIQDTGTVICVNKPIQPLLDQLISSKTDLPEVRLLMGDEELRDAYLSFQLDEVAVEKSDVFPFTMKDIKEYILIAYWALKKFGNLVMQWTCYPIHKWLSAEIDKLHQEFVEDIIATAPNFKTKRIV